MASSNDAKIMMERRASSCQKAVLCKRCNGFYSRGSFYKHKRRPCTIVQKEQETTTPGSVPINLLLSSVDNPDFTANILAHFQDYDIGRICKSDVWLKTIGQTQWNKMKQKHGKTSAVRKSVMRDMRRLGLLFKECKEMQPSMNLNDMFKREHFSVIEEVVQKITASENDSLKTGLKLGLKYLIPNAAKMIQDDPRDLLDQK